MEVEHPAWYCARTKAKQEHIAASAVRKNLKLEVFHPQLRVERVTRRGVVRVTEPVFPCYVFIRCIIEARLNEIQHTKGIRSLVHFGNGIPSVRDSVIAGLQECFEAEEPKMVRDGLMPGDEVTVGKGAKRRLGMRLRLRQKSSLRKRIPGESRKAGENSFTPASAELSI